MHASEPLDCQGLRPGVTNRNAKKTWRSLISTVQANNRLLAAGRDRAISRASSANGSSNPTTDSEYESASDLDAPALGRLQRQDDIKQSVVDQASSPADQEALASRAETLRLTTDDSSKTETLPAKG